MGKALEANFGFTPAQKPRRGIIMPPSFEERVYIAGSECRWDIVAPGKTRSTEVDRARFADLPESTIQRMQLFSTEAGNFVDLPIARDKYKDHDLRTDWRNGLLRRGFGIEVRKHFKKNKFAANTLTVLMSGARIAVRGLEAHQDQRGELDADAAEALRVAREVSQISTGFHHFGDEYADMTRRAKRAFVSEVSNIAEEYLDVVTAPEDKASK